MDETEYEGTRSTQLLELETVVNKIEETNGDTVDPSEAFTLGTVTSATRVPVSSVPADYPITMTDTEALELHVRLDSGLQTTVYTGWPDPITTETPLVQVLATLDPLPATLTDLYGEEIPLDTHGEHYVLGISPASTASSRWVYAVIGGLVSWLVIWFAAWIETWLVADWIAGLVIVLTWFLLPLVTYLDIRYVRATSDWRPNRLIWPILMFIWMLNLPVGLLYLYKRSRVSFRSR